MTDINVPLMRKCLEHLTAHPEEHDQDLWALQSSCGTTMCMAGHVVTLTGHDIDWHDHEGDLAASEVVTPVIHNGEETRAIPAVAAYELGLSNYEANQMFWRAATIEQLWELAEEFTDGEIEVPENMRVAE